ncbi:hypothetical protein [Klebsiella variicola]|uniref:hypothetical protein n=1 Tax=Klebsiella variicola TaxID=244366 RepID=UPI000FE16DD9|nr:hypothetical protein [Klebsiella variicola]QAA73229.1 hypothetical protein D4N21_17775 [Klebsiella variicola]
MTTNDEKCPFCDVHLIDKDHCHSCHAFKVKGYVSKDARKRINLVSICASLLIAILGILIVFMVSLSIGAYISIAACSLVFYFVMKKIMIFKEEKKGKTVWKRAVITW